MATPRRITFSLYEADYRKLVELAAWLQGDPKGQPVSLSEAARRAVVAQHKLMGRGRRT